MNKKHLAQYIIAASTLQPLRRIPFLYPSLNAITAGGIPVGKMVDLVGLPSAGKTTLALSIIAAAQRHGYATYFADQERTFDAHYAATVGVDTGKLLVIQTDTAERTLSTVEYAARQGNALIVVDSVSWLVPASMIDVGVEERDEAHAYDVAQKVAEQARLLTLFCKLITPVLTVHESTIVFVNQYRSNISPMSRLDKKPSGSFAYHHSISLRLEMQRIKNDDDGADVQVAVTKNRTGRERLSATLTLRHGEGFDLGADYLRWALEFGLIAKNGSWYQRLSDGQRAQGERAAIAQLLDDEMKAMIDKEMTGCGTE